MDFKIALPERRRTLLARSALVVCAVGWLWLGRPEPAPSAVDWACALAGLALSFAATARPLAVLAGQSAVLLAAERFGATTPVCAKVLVAVALLELAARRRGRAVAAGVLTVLAAYTVIAAQRPATDAAGMAYRTAVVVLVPLLLGAYLHALRRLVHESRERAAEAELRRRLTGQAVRAAERTAISREVHDLVAHHIAAIVLRVGVARHVTPAGAGPVAEVLEDVHESALRAMDDLKRLVGMLREPQADAAADVWPLDPEELLPALRALVRDSVAAGLLVEAQLDPALAELDPLQALAVLRVVQEGLTNVAKHAGLGAKVRIGVRRQPSGQTVVELVDGGGLRTAARPDRPQTGPGHGLVGLRERMALAGGVLSAGPALGGGWCLTATLPPPRPPGVRAVPAAIGTERAERQR